jgi:hypothetical protein
MGLDNAELISGDDISSQSVGEVEKKLPVHATAMKKLA